MPDRLYVFLSKHLMNSRLALNFKVFLSQRPKTWGYRCEPFQDSAVVSPLEEHVSIGSGSRVWPVSLRYNLSPGCAAWEAKCFTKAGLFFYLTSTHTHHSWRSLKTVPQNGGLYVLSLKTKIQKNLGPCKLFVCDSYHWDWSSTVFNLF